MDRDSLAVGEAFGSFTDPGFTAAGGPLSHLSGRVAYAWAGAVLHVLSKEDVEAFAKHVLGILAPGGVWFGVGRPSQSPSTVRCNRGILSTVGETLPGKPAPARQDRGV